MFRILRGSQNKYLKEEKKINESLNNKVFSKNVTDFYLKERVGWFKLTFNFSNKVLF